MEIAETRHSRNPKISFHMTHLPIRHTEPSGISAAAVEVTQIRFFCGSSSLEGKFGSFVRFCNF
jgi:hypothetical protein